MVRELGPDWVRSEELSYSAFGTGKLSRPQAKSVYRLGLQGVQSLEVVEAVSIPVTCSLLHRQSLPASVVRHLKPLACDYVRSKTFEVDMLIGLAAYWCLVRPGITLVDGGLVAQNTAFGWILSGCSSDAQQPHSTPQLLTLTDIPDEVVWSFWELDSFGVSPHEKIHPVLDEFECIVGYVDKHYIVALPWKKARPPLLNESLACRRLAR